MDQNAKPAPTGSSSTGPDPAAAAETAAQFVPHPDSNSAPPQAPPAAPASTGNLTRAFLAGLAGGALAFGLFFGLSQLFNPMADISERLAAAESNVAAAATRRALETTDKRLAALEARFDPLRSELENLNRSLNAAGSVDLTPLQRRLTALENATAALKQETTGEKSTVAPQLGIETAKLSLSLLISDRLEAGQPFLSELAALEVLGVDASVQPLLHDAANGSPSQVQLLTRFAALLPQLRKAIPVETNQSWPDRIWQSISGLVRIRRIDDAQASDPESRLHLITLALQASRNDEALKQFNLLPDAMRGQARDFETMLHKRLAAVSAGEALLKASAEDVLAASRTAKGAPK